MQLPLAHMALYREQAAAEGIPLGDYIVAALAAQHELEVPQYVEERRKKAAEKRSAQQREQRDQGALGLTA